MNMRAKFVLSIGVLGLLCLMLPGSLRADTVYTYTGQPYVTCHDTYTSGGGFGACAGPYALSGTIDVKAGTPLDNLTLFGAGSDISGDISTFSFTDGTGLTYTQANMTWDYSGGYWGHGFSIATDANGNITEWSLVGLVGGIWPALWSRNNGVNSYDETETLDNGHYPFTGGGWVIDVPGVWVETTVPEPSSYLLLVTGLLGLLALTVRSKRHVSSASC